MTARAAADPRNRRPRARRPEVRSWTAERGLRTPSGRWLSRTSNEAAAERFGGPVVLLHRAAVIGLLREQLPAGAVRTGCAAELVDEGDTGAAGRPARVRVDGAGLEPGERGSWVERGEIEADLVVGADGIHSAVRRALFPAHPAPRYAGFTAWRFVVPAPAEPFAAHETWGRGTLWGSQPLPDGRVYAYATAAVGAGQRAPDGDERAVLLDLFGTWHHPVPALLDVVKPDDVLRNDVYSADIPLPAHHRGRVVLLGDAAHALAPSLGQGGNQAIEDAIVLAHHAGLGADDPYTGTDIGAALAAYTCDRLPRTTEVVRRSARIGRMTTVSSAPACALRDAALTVLGRFGRRLALRSLDGIADWSPPGHAYAAGAHSGDGARSGDPGTARRS